MKRPLLLTVLLFSTHLACAQSSFPGLKAILSASEWERAGLDRLSPDELGVVDAALIRYQKGTTSQLQGEVVAAKQSAAAAVAQASTPAAVEKKKSLWERFGLPIMSDADWEKLPPMRAKVVSWEAGNKFKLDNGQVWEGFQSIPYELVGKEIEIQARPMGRFVLIVDGKNTTLRVLRLR